ncbi:hypothetical protein E2L05_03680 [Meridianimarinicoccus aquatilis]|uniref:UvrD-like helicase C-terminal domain-containing protein n=2 Tax=Meridianimarinicoccus aquatilis TaxID=2552766 RepID=A0A4R6B503_9RHOB|nr:hypothetical protein E2L05_03680 [Fluviibacterium aquatile]
MHRAKGFKFSAVVSPFFSDSVFPPPDALKAAVDAADREGFVTQYQLLLYVAATRAKRALRISWSGAPSSLLNISTD